LTYYTTEMTTTTEQKVYNLTVELDDIKKRKKQFVKAYNAEIKRISEEIADILNPEDAVAELP
jgi:flagellar capping protein FliD